MNTTPASRLAFHIEYLRQGSKHRMLAGSSIAIASYQAFRLSMKAFIHEIYVKGTPAEKATIREGLRKARADYEYFEVPRG
jgi:hypothetical protein